MNPLFRILLCLVGTAFASAVGAVETRDRDYLMQGFDLSEDEVAAYEQTARDNPDHLPSRAVLLGYYFRRRFDDAAVAMRHQDLVLWLIEHHPESDLFEAPPTRLLGRSSPEGYAKAKALWESQLKSHERNAVVLANAAQFFLLTDMEVAEKHLKRAQEFEPDSTQWALKLGRLYQLRSNRERGDQRRESAKLGLAQFQRALESMDDRHVHRHLDRAAKLALEAGDDDQAEAYAQQLLTLSALPDNRRNTGNAIHHGNLILGRVALRRGDVELAKSSLLEAGKTTGSPQLKSFGPNMALAQELLEHGERDVVLEYFELCRKFWDRDELDEWTAAIKGGGMPKFGANLNY